MPRTVKASKLNNAVMLAVVMVGMKIASAQTVLAELPPTWPPTLISNRPTTQSTAAGLGGNVTGASANSAAHPAQIRTGADGILEMPAILVTTAVPPAPAGEGSPIYQGSPIFQKASTSAYQESPVGPESPTAPGNCTPQVSPPPAEPKCESCPNGSCDDWCNLGEPFKLQDLLCGENNHGITIGGWMDWGYFAEPPGGFDVNPNRVLLNQSWLYAEKVADGSEGLDWGFRTDIMYGEDAFATQSYGNPPGTWDFQNGWDHGIYGWAMPQLYGQVAYGDLSVIAGHFFTIAGYEVINAPGNFFFSHAFTHFFNEPFTHTGVLGTYTASDDMTLYGGWTAGWDTGFEDFNDGDSSDGSNFLGGFKVPVLENVTFTYVTTVGDLGWRGEGYYHSLLFNTQINEQWTYILESDLVETNLGGDHNYSLVHYLFYWPNPCLGFGGRAEWWKFSGSSVYEVTFGTNIKPHANLVIRPEVRHQWASDAAAVNALGIPDDETIFGIDAILTF